MRIRFRDSLIEKIFGIRRKSLKYIALLPCPVADTVFIAFYRDKGNHCVCLIIKRGINRFSHHRFKSSDRQFDTHIACIMRIRLCDSLIENIFGVRRKTFKNIALLPCSVAETILISVYRNQSNRFVGLFLNHGSNGHSRRRFKRSNRQFDAHITCVMRICLRDSLIENIFGVRRKPFKNIARLPCPVAAFILITVISDKNHACVRHGFGNRRRGCVGNRLCLFGKIVFNGTGSDRNTRSTFYRSNNNCVFINNAIIFNIE